MEPDPTGATSKPSPVREASAPNGGSESRTGSRFKDAVASVLAIIIILSFIAMIYFLLQRLNLPEAEWARAMFLFAGVEAIAFAAAGFFFGTQVQRGNVQEAKAEARAASAVAAAADEAAESERTNSTMLAEGVLATAKSGGGGGGLLGGDDNASDPAMGALVAQAEALLRARGRR